MARPIKQGIDYYPKDVKAKYDTKFKYVESKNTFIARLVIYELWDLIYGEEGYYTKFDNIKKVLFLGDLPISEQQLDDILESCFEIEMFDKNLYEKYEVLTSPSIQKRFLAAIGRRKKVNVFYEYFLLPKNEYVNINWVYVDINSINDDNNPENADSNTQSKVKERKGKEIKVKNNNATELVDPLINFFQANGFGSYTQFISEDITHTLNDFKKNGSTDDEALELVIRSLEISVENNVRSWKYAKSILNKWIDKALKNVDMVEAEEKKFRAKYKQDIPEVVDDELPF